MDSHTDSVLFFVVVRPQVAAELDLSSRIPGLDLEGPLQEVLWLVKTTREQLSSMTSPMVLEGTLENSHYQALLPSAELEWHKERWG